MDAQRDIAVLKIHGVEDLHPLPVGCSSDLLVGQKAFAIGNPFGLDHTLTTGVVSGLGREITGRTGRPISGIIQTDAAINPGSSGGPLINSAGELIGVNTAIYSPSGSNAGVGFAIPVDLVSISVSQIIKHGRVRQPSLGILLGPDHLLKKLNLQGALVYRTVPDSGAAKAGVVETLEDRFGRVQLGEVIIGVNGRSVKSSMDLFRALDQCEVGQMVELRLQRVAIGQQQGRSERVVEIKLQEKQELTQTAGLLGGQQVKRYHN